MKNYYPLDIAKELSIAPHIVYDIIDGMSENERNNMIKVHIEKKKRLLKKYKILEM